MIGVITGGLPTSGEGRYAYEIVRHLKDKTDIELVLCTHTDVGKIPYAKHIIKGIEFPFLGDTLNAMFNNAYVHRKKIPEYDLYHITNHHIVIDTAIKPAIVTVLDMIYMKPEYLRGIPKYAHFSRYLIPKPKHLENVKKIIAISEDTKKDLINLMGIEEERISVIPLGVDLKRFTPKDKMESRKKLGLPIDKKIILNIGPEPNYNKNVISLIKAFYQLQKEHPDAMLVRIGVRSPKVTSMICDLGLDKSVLRIERTAESELATYYSSADVYVCVDVTTGFGLPLLESMASGTCTVCSKNGAFPEVVGDVGLLVDPFDINQISNSISRLLKNDNLRQSLIKKGLKRAAGFTWDGCAERTLRIYKKFI